MGYSNAGGQQRGPLSDPRHGRGRAEMIAGRRGARALTQIFYVVVLILGVVALYLAVVALNSESSLARWGTIGLLVGALGAYVLWRVNKHLKRQSLDDVLRSRRANDHPNND